jgi:hypothetical protein
MMFAEQSLPLGEINARNLLRARLPGGIDESVQDRQNGISVARTCDSARPSEESPNAASRQRKL